MTSDWGIMDLMEDFSSCFRVIFKVDLADLGREKVIWQKSDVFIRIYSPFKVFSSTKKVCNCVTFAREMGDFEIIIL